MSIYAIKGNVQVAIADNDKAAYLADGYDINRLTDAGELELVEASPKKTVPYAEYAALKAELEALKAPKKAKQGE